MQGVCSVTRRDGPKGALAWQSMSGEDGTRVRKITATVASGALALTLLTGCTGDDGKSGNGGGSSGGGGDQAPARIETKASVGQVAGKLGKGKRRKVLADVTAVVDGWLDAAYVEGDYPRSDFGNAFPGFTKGAAKLAAKDRRTMSNARLGKRIERVEVVKRNMKIDVLAPGGKFAGATARVMLVVALGGEVERRDRIHGRVLLTPTKGGWRVFGFDVRRNRVKGKK